LAIESAVFQVRNDPAGEVLDGPEVTAGGVHCDVALRKWLRFKTAVSLQLVRFGNARRRRVGHRASNVEPCGLEHAAVEKGLPASRPQGVDDHAGDVVAEIGVSELARREWRMQSQQVAPRGFGNCPGIRGAGDEWVVSDPMRVREK